MQIPLPPKELRQGGRHFLDDSSFVASAMQDAERLRDLGALTRESRVLDFGCGAGRLAYGLINAGWFTGTYLGIEVQPRHVDWCTNQITTGNPDFRFKLVNTRNDRYNPTGKEDALLPVETGSIDLFYGYSVFSHMIGVHVWAYLKEIARVLKPEGRAFVTMFTEPNVPDETENPPWYGPFPWSRPLHCVLYSIDRLEYMVGRSGLAFEHFFKGAEVDGQTGLVLKKDYRSSRIGPERAHINESSGAPTSTANAAA